MSKAQQLIKDLKLKQEKIEFLTIILESVKDYKEVSDPVKEEIHDLLSDFVEKAVLKIESGQNLSESSGQFTEEEVKALKQVVGKLSQKRATQPQSAYEGERPQKTEPSKKPAPTNDNPQDKLRFAMENRHLAGKTVTVANDKNMIIKGEVVGLDAPYIMVKTEKGQTIKVPYENVSLA